MMKGISNATAGDERVSAEGDGGGEITSTSGVNPDGAGAKGPTADPEVEAAESRKIEGAGAPTITDPVGLEAKAAEASKDVPPWLIVAAAGVGAAAMIAAIIWLLWPGGGTKVVIEDNFDEAPKSGWSTTKTETTPNGKAKFLGQFQSGAVKLALNNLPPHKIARVDFDLYVINGWKGSDSSAGNGPDYFTLYQGEEDAIKQAAGSGPNRSRPKDVVYGNSSLILLFTTFSNLADRKQLYACENGAYLSPSCYFSREERAAYGAAAVDSLGFKKPECSKCADSVYKIKRVFAHDKSDLTLTFVGQSKEKIKEAGDEAWGLDNVRVEVR
jgi:hypothetical protein